METNDAPFQNLGSQPPMNDAYASVSTCFISAISWQFMTNLGCLTKGGIIIILSFVISVLFVLSIFIYWVSRLACQRLTV